MYRAYFWLKEGSVDTRDIQNLHPFSTSDCERSIYSSLPNPLLYYIPRLKLMFKSRVILEVSDQGIRHDEYLPCPLPCWQFIYSQHKAVTVMSKMRPIIISYYLSIYSYRYFLFLLSFYMDFSFLSFSFFSCGGYLLKISQSQTLSSRISLTHSTGDIYLWYSTA